MYKLTTVVPAATNSPAPENAPSNPYLLAIVQSNDLPHIDLSNILARKLFSRRTHDKMHRFMRANFHILAWLFRVGISCFVGMLFVTHGPLHGFFLAMLVPSTQSLIATVFFQSIDVLRLLTHSYEYWVAATLNAFHWGAFALVLGNERAMASYLGCFAFHTVITVDASFRTFPAAINSMFLGIPIIFVLWCVVSLQSLDEPHFFSVSIRGHFIYDASDFMGFTASNFAVLLIKILLLKKRRVRMPSTGPGYLTQPSALIKTTLRLVPLSEVAAATSFHSQRRSPSRASTREPFHQQVRLSPLPLSRIDARRTVLPFRFWNEPPMWIARHQNAARFLLYAVGAVGYGLLSFESYRSISVQLLLSRLETPTGANGCRESPFIRDRTRILAASCCTAVFGGCFAAFYQRDLLRLLLVNFDYVFSIVQVWLYCVSLADMACWQVDHTLVIMTWVLWLMWALTIDALTPLVKRTVLRFPTKLAAIVLASVLLSGLGALYVVLFVESNGLRNRTLAHITISGHSFTITMRAIMLGRSATISLWCTRQVYVLYARGDDELHLIRGLVEYESPYGVFPRKHNKHTPALDD